MNQKLKEKILEVSGEQKKLPCKKAFEIASKLDVKLSEIGKICNDESIKICTCQLGCFK